MSCKREPTILGYPSSSVVSDIGHSTVDVPRRRFTYRVAVSIFPITGLEHTLRYVQPKLVFYRHTTHLHRMLGKRNVNSNSIMRHSKQAQNQNRVRYAIISKIKTGVVYGLKINGDIAEHLNSELNLDSLNFFLYFTQKT